MKEYHKNKAQLKSAIASSNFKLDDKYKTLVDQSTLTMEQSVKAGLKVASKKAEVVQERSVLSGLKRVRKVDDDLDSFLGSLKRPKLQ